MKPKTAFKVLGGSLLLGAFAFNLNIGAKKEAFAANHANEAYLIQYVTEGGDNLKQKVEEQYNLVIKITNAQGENIHNADIQWLAYMDGVGPVNKEDLTYQKETGAYSLRVPLCCEYCLFISAEGYEPKEIGDVRVNESGHITNLEVVLNKK